MIHRNLLMLRGGIYPLPDRCWPGLGATNLVAYDHREGEGKKAEEKVRGTCWLTARPPTGEPHSPERASFDVCDFWDFATTAAMTRQPGEIETTPFRGALKGRDKVDLLASIARGPVIWRGAQGRHASLSPFAPRKIVFSIENLSRSERRLWGRVTREARNLTHSRDRSHELEQNA